MKPSLDGNLGVFEHDPVEVTDLEQEVRLIPFSPPGRKLRMRSSWVVFGVEEGVSNLLGSELG